MLQSLHIVINMSPTGEGAVSLSLDKVHAKRDCLGVERWVGSRGEARARGARRLPRGKGDRPGAQSLSSSLASQMVGFWPLLAATLPPSCVLAPGKWALRCSRELGLEVWEMKRQQLGRGEAFW